MPLHLDSEYRNRWEEFYLSDGTIEDSRQKNWREVHWASVEKIVVHIKDKTHEVKNDGKDFKGFLNFRWGGQEAVYAEDKTYIGHKPIKIWTVGWTNGNVCFLTDIDFFTGEVMKHYTAPLEQFKNHLHPDIKDKVLGVE